jgi:hypothetical protein
VAHRKTEVEFGANVIANVYEMLEQETPECIEVDKPLAVTMYQPGALSWQIMTQFFTRSSSTTIGLIHRYFIHRETTPQRFLRPPVGLHARFKSPQLQQLTSLNIGILDSRGATVILCSP